MPLISVITATRGDGSGAQWAERAWDSLASQELPAGWEFEWLVQADGGPQVARDYLEAAGVGDDPRVRGEGMDWVGGAAITRTTALVRARGAWVCILDDDDTLPAGSLGSRIGVLSQDPRLAWVAGRVEQVTPDGARSVLPRAPRRSGHITPVDALSELGANSCFPAYPMTLLARTDAVWAVGAWGALPVGEDNLLLGGLTSCFDGWFLDSVVYTWRRRRWGSITSDPGVADWSTIYRAAQYRRALCAKRLLGGGVLMAAGPVLEVPPTHVHTAECAAVGCGQGR